MRDSYHGRYYAKAQNLGRKLASAYDGALDSVDLLVMPTLPMKATPLPAAYSPREEVVARALEMIPNTAPFDVSGHPAMTAPCGFSDGLPVGMMLVGKRWDEETVLRAARAFEQTGTYTVRPGVVASG
jgi:amidase